MRCVRESRPLRTAVRVADTVENTRLSVGHRGNPFPDTLGELPKAVLAWAVESHSATEASNCNQGDNRPETPLLPLLHVCRPFLYRVTYQVDRAPIQHHSYIIIYAPTDTHQNPQLVARSSSPANLEPGGGCRERIAADRYKPRLQCPFREYRALTVTVSIPLIVIGDSSNQVSV
jgi:hypothetical protein